MTDVSHATFLGLTLLLLGCGGAATKILPLRGAEAEGVRMACERVFPRGPFEVTHVVEASIPLSDDVSLIGVVAAEPDSRGFRSVLLTQEGVVLFDAARRGAALSVTRAVPPLDPDGFGRHMTDDVALVLLRPAGDRVEVGQTQDGTPICRWANGDEHVEVQVLGPRAAQLTRIRSGSIVRRASLTNIGDDGFARDVVLETTSIVGYRLHLVLVDFNRQAPGTEAHAVTAPAMP